MESTVSLVIDSNSIQNYNDNIFSMLTKKLISLLSLKEIVENLIKSSFKIIGKLVQKEAHVKKLVLQDY